jgi:hypothetical protein
MHENDFRDDLNPTAAQWRRIAQEFARLAGEPAPASRRAAAELLLRLERSDSAAVVDAAAAAAAIGAGQQTRSDAADFRARRARTGSA